MIFSIYCFPLSQLEVKRLQKYKNSVARNFAYFVFYVFTCGHPLYVHNSVLLFREYYRQVLPTFTKWKISKNTQTVTFFLCEHQHHKPLNIFSFSILHLKFFADIHLQFYTYKKCLLVQVRKSITVLLKSWKCQYFY